jgi:RNA polymerase sigma factor (sigma-70 family)
MDAGPVNAVLQHVRRLATVETVRALPDNQLLQRFLASQEEAAFAALLHRHGPMVWRVCQRVLRHRQDAEDVFQATFLALARKAATIRKMASVACWLHGVAYRLARRLQAEKARKLTWRPGPTDQPHDPADQASGQELQAVLDEELDQLPDKYRTPLVLCYLEGRTRDEAAKHLGWSLGTFKRRLDRGRKLLATRLTRRGVTLGVTLFSAVLVPDAVSAAVPPTLINLICKAVTPKGAGEAATGILSAQVAALTEGMVNAMAKAKLKLVAAVVLAVLTLAGGMGLWAAHQMRAGEPPTLQAGPVGENPAAKQAGEPPASKAGPAGERHGAKATVEGELAVLIKRGDYLVNQVARCGNCHTPRNAKGELDLSRHLQGADIWFTPKPKPRGRWADEAPNITARGRAGKWTEDRLIKFLSAGEKPKPPMPAYQLSMEDARAVTAYLRSLPGKNKVRDGKKKVDD